MSALVSRACAGLVLVVIGTLLAAPAPATTFIPETKICPVGGKTFTAQIMASNSTFGQRPDGKPYSPTPVPPIIECPDNGFLLYKDAFSSDEVKRATPLVASDVYQAMRSSETQHYRSWWLQNAMGSNDPYALATALLIASWETDNDPARKARYQQAFLDTAAALRPDGQKEDWFWITLRAANASRELGLFDAALSRLDDLAEKTEWAGGDTDPAFLLHYLSTLKALAQASVTASEPTMLVPAEEAAFRCVLESTTLAAIERTACESENVMTAISRAQITTDDGQDLTGEAAIRYIAKQWR
ncbi:MULTISPECIES: hypothetical protein [unclassified Sphingobium]|uniref:hypothetical protein n=1 Tax=unclassified Sphingobium TaxID=2611147 RepID=UPI002224303E|nr:MULTISPECIES: hypothetical protein [unclassified Sphingobium]MCW2396318.1 hypothetical protein [Sphingobium sp. B8D3B]MCW2419834.1 hypothetical protein [Sphingobium sp. B8D3C]